MSDPVLVTGAAGFIGFHTTLRLLQRGEKVIGIDNLNDYYDVSLKEARLEQLANFTDFKFIKQDIADKTGMEELSVAKNAFIRPSPSAGSLGGVARKTRESIVLCEAAGFDTVFVETVGVGQSETAVHSMVDFFLLIQLAGTGDELQGIKRGIMEMADGIAINKCDGNNVDKANVARVQFKNALHLFPAPESGWIPDVVTCSAIEISGIDKVWEMVERYVHFSKTNGYFAHKRNSQSKYWMYESINEALRSNFYHNNEIKNLLTQYENRILSNEISSFVAAHELLEKYFGK